MKYYLIAFLCLFGCGDTNFNEYSGNREETTIKISGEIRKGDFDQLMMRVGNNKLENIYIRSPGGDVEETIKIANYIYDNEINLVIDGACFSSCANYIFVAGKNKHITKNGIVAWHGNIEHYVYYNTDEYNRDLSINDMQLAIPILKLERDFYKKVEIDGFVSWFGKIYPYGSNNFFSISASDMAYFGVLGVSVDEESNIGKRLSFWSDYGVEIDYITIDINNIEIYRPNSRKLDLSL